MKRKSKKKQKLPFGKNSFGRSKKHRSQSAASQGSYALLESIVETSDLRRLPLKQLPLLCEEIRRYLIAILSNVGGHFASNLGVVELSVALHYVFETPRDRLIWDVGHQIYPHKILTGRRSQLKSVRQTGGLSGFPKRDESPYDLYDTGHAGTSISQLLGEAIARDIKGEDYKCLCVIGDASIAAGMALEALNHGGHLSTDSMVVLNDNDMSISHNVGALNQYLNRLIVSPFYNYWRALWLTLLMSIPIVGPALRTLSRRLARSFLDFFTPGGFFVNLGFRYIGPVDGHNVLGLVKILRKLKKLKEPILLHVYTQKGQGYKPAEKNPIRYHSVSLFNPEDGSFKSAPPDNQISYSQIVGETLLSLAQNNRHVLAITPAMIEGSGLRPLYNALADRVFDVGIAEQHSVTFSGALAKAGLVPYLCIYSTFLNRGIDQLIQDVALMNFPVRIVIDRAGCVGADGETHQGLYDLGMLLAIPNIQVYAPATGAEIKAMLHYMEDHNSSPIAMRFPKDTCLRSELELAFPEALQALSSYKPHIRGEGRDLGIICIGAMWKIALAVQENLHKDSDIETTIISLRWLRPLDNKSLCESLSFTKHFIIIEDSYLHCSAAAWLLQNLPPELAAKRLESFAFPARAIEHGKREDIFEIYGLSASAITRFLRNHPIYHRKKQGSFSQSSEI